ncbi:MAG: TIGR04282 family arsenosugar biosynthesis glycosyltransferase, partial [Nitrospirota bacterium]|nr:TIGR04282 family arsenosugar biosynthesis glycosyltransferase [Nitrospirota bacterium]
RLTPKLSKVEAAKLQEAFIKDLLNTTKQLATTDSVQCAIACTPVIEHPFFQACGEEYDLRFILQKGNDLGERMHNAFLWGFENGFEKIVIIGCDSPTLPPDLIRQAFEQLSNTDLVVGPGLDGGYYLIGAPQITAAKQQGFSALFTGINWGTESVLTKTLEKLNTQKYNYDLLPFWYDIDQPSDLVFLKEHLKYLGSQQKDLPYATIKMLDGLTINKNSQK